MKARVIISAVALCGMLSACGAANGLKPPAAAANTPKPYGATAAPTAAQLLTPTSQARPERSDELIRKSERRRGDDFDLPPS